MATPPDRTGRSPDSSSVRVAIANDYEIVVSGLARMLSEYRDRVDVVEIDAQTPVLSDADVVLVDTFGRSPCAALALADLVRDSDAIVVLFSWEMSRDNVAIALHAGAGGCLSKSLGADEIVGALEAIRGGEIIVLTNAPDADDDQPVARASWPGRAEGLSSRESEVLAFITQGLSNQEIAQTVFLSINSVKTYIRAAYRKIGVRTRSQAVGWGMQHGFESSPMRLTDPAARERSGPHAAERARLTVTGSRQQP